MDCIIQGQPLPPRCRDHLLEGNFKGVRECHVEPDWLLLYFQDADRIVFVDTGTHADLFRQRRVLALETHSFEKQQPGILTFFSTNTGILFHTAPYAGRPDSFPAALSEKSD